MPSIEKAMPFVKKVVVSMWETVVEDLTKLPKIVAKSLIICPAFYVICRLVSHHAPLHDWWFGFLLGALVFTSASKRANSRPDKEEPKQPSAIVLPASL